MVNILLLSMKKKILVVLGFATLVTCVNAQYVEPTIKKLCINGHVSSLVYIHYQNNTVIAKIDQGNSYAGLSAITGEQIYLHKLPHGKNIGFGFCAFGQSAMFSCLNNTYNDKTKRTIFNETIYFIDPVTGIKSDTLNVPYNIAAYCSMNGITQNLCYIVQESNGKMSAVVADRVTGSIRHRLFTQVKEAGFEVVPNTLAVDSKEKFVAVGTANGSKGFYLFDLRKGKLLWNNKGRGDIFSIVFSSDGQRCFYIQQKKLYTINLSSLTVEKTISLPNEGIYMAFHPNGKTIAVTGFGTPTELCLVHTDLNTVQKTSFRSRGGAPYYSNEGQLFVPSQQGVQCFVDPVKLPYLAMIAFDDTTDHNNALERKSGTYFFKGDRIFALYSGDGKYYSATVIEAASGKLQVLFDDGYEETIEQSKAKELRPLKVGEYTYVKNADGKFYSARIISISGNLIELEYANGIHEKVHLSTIMQVLNE